MRKVARRATRRSWTRTSRSGTGSLKLQPAGRGHRGLQAGARAQARRRHRASEPRRRLPARAASTSAGARGLPHGAARSTRRTRSPGTSSRRSTSTSAASTDAEADVHGGARGQPEAGRRLNGLGAHRVRRRGPGEGRAAGAPGPRARAAAAHRRLQPGAHPRGARRRGESGGALPRGARDLPRQRHAPASTSPSSCASAATARATCASCATASRRRREFGPCYFFLAREELDAGRLDAAADLAQRGLEAQPRSRRRPARPLRAGRRLQPPGPGGRRPSPKWPRRAGSKARLRARPEPVL